jgi:bifunctional UDP-N-acetylglucosamine pyrophosphorylase/glucosamine-1-phosphate N-acetyltransferase
VTYQWLSSEGSGKTRFMSDLSAIVLAAGLGKRMKSSLPKVLHPCAGRPLVHYPVRAAFEAGAGQVVVVASPETKASLERELVAAYGADRVAVTVQNPPRGTGDAARVGVTPVKSPRVLILCGDTPLLTADDLRPLIASLPPAGAVKLAVLSAVLQDPTGYGRVLRDAMGNVTEIREHKDCNDDQRAVTEVNAGVYVVETPFLRDSLQCLSPANAQGEYYLTDVVAMAAAGGGAVGVVGSRDSLLGVNDRSQLVEAESLLFARIARQHAKHGVTVRAGACIEDTVTFSGDALVGANAHLRGRTQVGLRTVVDVGCVVTDAKIGDDVVLAPYSVVRAAEVAAGTRTSPHAVVVPDAGSVAS